jgi:ABC-type antimicrobial peptide transport system permease subunit
MLVVKAIAGVFPAGLPVSMFGVLISTGFAVGVGLFAGLYPSLTAARLTPVEALRA